MQTGMIRLRFMESKEMRERGASRKKAGSRPEKTGGESNFVVQGSILAIASIVVRIIGIAYRIPMINIIGDEGMGYYGTAFNVYNIALLLSSYSLPLAVSKMVSVRLARKQYRNSVRILRAALVYISYYALEAKMQRPLSGSEPTSLQEKFFLCPMRPLR